MKTKTGSAIVTFLAVLVGAEMPDAVRSVFGVLTLFIVVDTVFGVCLAGIEGRFRSRTVYTMLVSKMVQYSILGALFLGATVMMRQWAILVAGLSALVSIEAVSLIETAVRLEKTGVSLGPIRPFLNRVQKYLAVSAEPPSGK